MDPKGKVAILTGGARIGQVVAHVLALRGCNLALTYRGSRDAAEAPAQAAIREGVRAITIQADATDEDQVLPAVQQTYRELGRIDILLNVEGRNSAVDHNAIVEAVGTLRRTANTRSSIATGRILTQMPQLDPVTEFARGGV
jgi:NAD(P)-dependent dehydrogenase (short-subunit alcohol dehydrogenase family)